MTIRVLLVDDQELFREAVAIMLARDPRIAEVATASDAHEGIEQVRAHAVDVVLMDIRMPGMDGIVATREILRLKPGIRILMLTTFDLDQYVVEAIREGASGFLTKDATPQELADAVVAAAAGDAAMSPRATAALLGFVRAGGRSRSRARTAQWQGARGRAGARDRRLQRRHRAGAVPQREHGEDARQGDPCEARPRRPRAGRDLGLRERRAPPRAVTARDHPRG